MRSFILIMIFTQFVFGMTKTELDDKISQLLQVRTTIDSLEISKVNSPFYIDKNQSQETVTFSLFAIVDKRAKINNKWCGINDEISHGYKLVYVNKEKVGISNSSQYIELNLKDMKNVKIKLK